METETLLAGRFCSYPWSVACVAERAWVTLAGAAGSKALS